MVDVFHKFDDGPRRAAVLRQAQLHTEACAGTDPDWLTWWERTEDGLRSRACLGRELGRCITRRRIEEEERLAFEAEGEMANRAQWLLQGERLPPDDGDGGAAAPAPEPHRPLAPGA